MSDQALNKALYIHLTTMTILFFYRQVSKGLKNQGQGHSWKWTSQESNQWAYVQILQALNHYVIVLIVTNIRFSHSQ